MSEAIWFTAGGAGGSSIKQLEYPQISFCKDGTQFSMTAKFKNGGITTKSDSIPEGLRQLADAIEKVESTNRQPGLLIIEY